MSAEFTNEYGTPVSVHISATPAANALRSAHGARERRQVFVRAGSLAAGTVCGPCRTSDHLFLWTGFTDFDLMDFGCPCCYVEHRGPNGKGVNTHFLKQVLAALGDSPTLKEKYLTDAEFHAVVHIAARSVEEAAALATVISDLRGTVARLTGELATLEAAARVVIVNRTATGLRQSAIDTLAALTQPSAATKEGP